MAENASTARSLWRSSTAPRRSSLLPKRVYTAARLKPASAAISSIEAPPKPFLAKTVSAASSMALRVSRGGARA